MPAAWDTPGAMAATGRMPRMGSPWPAPMVTRTCWTVRGPRASAVTWRLPIPSTSTGPSGGSRAASSAAAELQALLPPAGPVLVLGVGNRRVTADALGPRTVQHVLVTMGAGHGLPIRGIRPVAAIAPGVSQAAGISLQALAAALVGAIRPAALICVDSLCSSEAERLGRTIQLSDTGLAPAAPGSGRHLDAAGLGLPVIAAGIPTLMESDEGHDLVVTPRALDSVIAHGSALLGAAINRALQPRLTVNQLCWLSSQA